MLPVWQTNFHPVEWLATSELQPFPMKQILSRAFNSWDLRLRLGLLAHAMEPDCWEELNFCTTAWKQILGIDLLQFYILCILIHVEWYTMETRARDKVHIFMSKMSISWPNHMFDLLLDLSHWDNSIMWSNIDLVKKYPKKSQLKIISRILSGGLIETIS